MVKKLIFVWLLTFLCSTLGFGQQSGPDKSRSDSKSCELTDADYSVYSALMRGLGGPEDAEEAWDGKEIVIVNVTSSPNEVQGGWGTWGFRSKSKAAPTKETVANFETKKHSSCPVEAKFDGSLHDKLIESEQIEKMFKKGEDGWRRFYEKYPNSAGFWGFSRPGYSPSGDEALLYVSHTCGWLCGTGHLYFLKKENGKWEVKNRLMLWIS